MQEVIKFLSTNSVKFREHVSGRSLTTFAIGGEIPLVIEPNNSKELVNVVRFLVDQNTEFKVIGAGSNILIPDQGLDAPLIKLGKSFRLVQDHGQGNFYVSSSMPLMQLSRQISKAGYSGLEFAGGIPASFGGAVKMNAGAHKGEISSILEEVVIATAEGVHRLSRQELKFDYRKSYLPEKSVIIGAKIKLVSGDGSQIFEKQQQHLAYRKSTQPLQMPSAGSIFKNPNPDKGVYAGEIIEKSGLKGIRHGYAEISNLHANWIVNPTKNASSQDVKSLIRRVQEEVKSKKSIFLETELIIW